MRFRLVPKSVTLNDLERRNGRHFASFHRTRVLYDVVVKQLPRFQNLLLIVYDHIKAMCAFVFFAQLLVQSDCNFSQSLVS